MDKIYKLIFTMDDGTEQEVQFTAPQGEKGTDGQNGEDGVGISKIEKTSSTGNVDTYTITFTDGSTSTFTVTNGVDGADGADGYTPIKGKDYFDGADGKDGSDGVSPTVSVSKSGKVTTVAITDKNGTKTATINDGADGTNGKDGVNGKDGTSVSVSYVSESTVDGGSNVVTFSDGKTLTVKNGTKGSKGDRGEKGEQGIQGEKGADGAKGDKGDKGDAGTNGKDGTSVTVKSVSESTADGGSNIVTFSDGKTITIKNGSKGTTGATGPAGKDGKDYVLTEADKAEIVNEAANTAKNALMDELPNDQTLIDNIAERVPYVKVAEQPTFVDSIDQMTDTSKMYVLKSDGMFYSYKEHTVTTPGGTTANFTNQVPISTDTDGSIFNGTGYKENVRLSSSGGISSSAQSGSVTTGFIPWYGDTTYLRMKGVEWLDAANKYKKHLYVNYYDSNKKFLVYHSSGEHSNGNNGHIVTVTRDSNGVETIKWSETYGTSNSMLQYVREAAYIRITAYGKGADMIVTINEEITYTTTEGGTTTTYEWESTGISYNQPADYEDRIVIAEADIDRLESKSVELANRVVELENNGGTGGGGNDDESCYNVQINKLYADGIVEENTALKGALETLCNRRDGSTQSSQVINLKKSEAQKLILHLHKRENDGYDTTNDVYLPNAQPDFSDVRITTNTGKLLKYQTVYSGNIDVISDSRLGNSEVSFLSDGDGNLYIGRDNAAWKSTDAGKSWVKLNIGNIPSTERIRIVSFVCEDGTLFISTYGGLLYKSEPPYTTSRLVLDMTENGLYTGIGIRPFQFVQLPTGEMLLGSYQSEFAVRIWKSIDNGETWTKMYEDIGGDYQHVHRMYVDAYQNPVAIYAGLDRGWYYKILDEETDSYYHTSGCVLRSTDGGSTWINLYEDQKGKPQAVDHGVIYADESGYRLLGGETAIVGGSSIVRTTDDIHFEAVLNAGHSVYGAEKLNGHLFAAGCGCSSGKNATLYMSDDEGMSWRQIYSEEPTLSDDIASAGIKTFHKGVFAGTDYEQLIAHNNIEEVKRASKRIICDDNSSYAEIIVDVPEGTTSLTVESGYMCPNLAVINNDVAIPGEAIFVMDFNENGRYIKEKVSGEIYKGDHTFTDGGKHLGYIYPDIKSAADMKAIKMNSPIFDDGIKKKLNLNASDVGLTISFWLLSDINANFKIITHNSDTLYFDDGIWYNGRRIGVETINEGGRFVKVDIVIDGQNNVIKSFSNGICTYTTSEQEKLNLIIPFLTGEKEYTLLKRVVDDDVLAIQHFEIRHGVPTDKEVYDAHFGGLTDNY